MIKLYDTITYYIMYMLMFLIDKLTGKSKRALENRKKKLRWGKSLRVGDRVCDCRLKHSKIKTITPLVNEGETSLGHELTCKFGEVYDYDIEFVDGSLCSLLYCCDPVDDYGEI